MTQTASREKPVINFNLNAPGDSQGFLRTLILELQMERSDPECLMELSHRVDVSRSGMFECKRSPTESVGRKKGDRV